MADYTEQQPLLIRSEDEAWEAIQELIDKRSTIQSVNALRFEGWPEITAYIPGARLNGALTPYMMEGFVDLQRAIYRSHAILTHEQANARVLSDYEKDRLELVVRVEEGSSDNTIDFWDIALQIGRSLVDKMDPTSIVITILGLGVLYAGQSAFRVWIDAQKEEKIAEIQSKQVVAALDALQFSQQADVERWQIMEKVKGAVPKFVQLEDDANLAKQSLTRHLTKNTDATINGVTVPQDAGQRLTRGTRSNSKEVRLDGVYRIVKVDTRAEDGFRVRLENIDTGIEFEAGVQDALISQEQKTTLQQAEWGKTPVSTKINAKEKSGEIFDAIVVEVEPYAP